MAASKQAERPNANNLGHKMQQSQDMAASSATAAGTSQDFGATKTIGASGGADTQLLETTIKEGQTLIDRFYDGGNRARPAALDILVVVLDGVVRRMRQQYSTKQARITEGNARCVTIDKSIEAIKLRQSPLIKELEEKKAKAAELKAAVDKGEEVIMDSVATAKAALAKASLLQRKADKDYISGLKLSTKGYDGKGKPLPGHEVNLRKRDKVGARKPGDMALCDDTALLARANAVLQGEKPGK